MYRNRLKDRNRRSMQRANARPEEVRAYANELAAQEEFRTIKEHDDPKDQNALEIATEIERQNRKR